MIFEEAHQYLCNKSEELEKEGLNLVEYLMMQIDEEDINHESLMEWATSLTHHGIMFSLMVGADIEEAMGVALLRGIWIGYAAGRGLHKEEHGR